MWTAAVATRASPGSLIPWEVAMAVRPTSPSIGGRFSADAGLYGSAQGEHVHRGPGIGSWRPQGEMIMPQTTRATRIPLLRNAHGRRPRIVHIT